MNEFPLRGQRPLAQLTFSERFQILMAKPYIKVIAFTCVVCVIIGYFVGSQLLDQSKTSNPESTNAIATTSAPPTSNPVNKISVYVTGAVTSPGVVELNSSARVIDALESAGNATPDADLSKCNLAQKLNDGMMITIPLKGQTENSSCGTQTDVSVASGDSPSAPAKVNLNTASQAELETLPGIGPSMAGSILAFRQSGGFKSINDLRKVKGIGDKRFADLKDLVDI